MVKNGSSQLIEKIKELESIILKQQKQIQILKIENKKYDQNLFEIKETI